MNSIALTAHFLMGMVGGATGAGIVLITQWALP
jgi:hypothetical protein